MALARSLVYRFFPVDCTVDISSDVVELSLDQLTWIAATHNTPDSATQAQYLAQYPVRIGTRQWVRILSGPTQAFAPPYGQQLVHGRITDNPEIPYLAWELNIASD